MSLKPGHCLCLLHRMPRGQKTRRHRRHDKQFRAFIGIGDSVVLTEDEEIIKLHVHSNEPLRVLARLAELGELQFSKIENMRAQHQSLTSAGEQPESRMPDKNTE